MGQIQVIHGPNLNLLGTREPELYGTTTLAELDARLIALGKSLGHEVQSFQSNHEGEIIDRIQSCREQAQALLLNAAGYTHTSVAIGDAIKAIRPIPCIEVHLTLPEAREAYRKTNFLSDAVSGRIAGFGLMSYVLALKAASELIAARGNL